MLLTSACTLGLFSSQILLLEMFPAIKLTPKPFGGLSAHFLAILNAALFKGSNKCSLPITLIFSL